ncbi:MAG: hypothetical protein R3F35_22520 [Myxococcota bacterium]
MTRDPIRRRFGRGAAKLRIGLPPGAERLAELARTKVRLERRLTIVPFLTAVAVIWLLATSPPIRVPEAQPKPSELELVLQSWPVRPAPMPIAPPTDRPRVADAAHPRSPAVRSAAHTATAPSAAATPIAPAEPTPPKSAPPFDPSSLATRGAAWTEPEVLASSAAAAAMPTFASARAPSARPSDLAPIASNETLALARAARAGEHGQATPIVAATPRAERPGSGAGPAGPSRALVEATAEGARARQAALAAIEAGDDAKGSRPVERRPAVSAPRTPTLALEGEAASSGRGTAIAGWEEVPLDALPDCDPPGRQDLLKKRILLAAAVQRECSHPSGSYRFVETRSLGAFLMWSRPDPHAGAGKPRDRDACDVLERALACLGDRSSQESQWR